MKNKLLLGLGIAVAGAGIYYAKKKNEEEMMKVGERDYVRNRLANKRDLKKFRKMFTDKDPHYNHIFAKDIAMSLNHQQTNRNHNVLVIGGTGTGKTGKYMYPNIMQCNASMVINDPDGLTFKEFAPYLIQNGYMVYHFDAAEPDCSSHYNPLMNVYDKDGSISPVKIDALVALCIKNAKAGREKGGGDPFWEKSEKAFLTAVIYYVLENDDIPMEDKCFHTVLEKIRQTRKVPKSDKQTDDFDKEFTSWREKCEKAGREIKAPIYYDVYLMAPKETAKTIVETTLIDLQIFADPKIDALTRHKSEYEYTHKQIDFDTIAQYPTALFVRIPKGNTLLSDLFYSQLYTRLYEFGEKISYHKYLIRDRNDTSAFACFDTMSEAVHFKKHATIVEREYQDGYSVYHIVDQGKIYRSCVSRDALETVLKQLPDMEVVEKVNYPGLPIHVDFYLDEFESISPIPNFLTILATCRKYRK